MPWCPKCKAAYEKGYKTCDVCGSELVEIEEKALDYAAYLTTAADSIEADLLESMLREYHIPVMRKYRGSGAYLNIIMGNTFLGIDLYVPASSLEDARNLISPGLQEENDENMCEVPEPSEDAGNAEIVVDEKNELPEDEKLRDEETGILKKGDVQ
ncbi:MAG TPA: DUF2007 domain-containing protein [Thermoclostridium sp.]|uniref:Signal transducing protein n=1 Tax=Thermoclostridium caenicola TaxID=659425 RepID=A0A1M6JCD0_9FIRM|nr:DUF2007 domain-containing protein [Thermoclostridium caenicola]SHJ44371.1 Putative signal transducing protein [Thermoclostridium caenicola]HOQ76825.1 DUF2007 domain-containing protein [Thermoclostridium sp.]